MRINLYDNPAIIALPPNQLIQARPPSLPAPSTGLFVNRSHYHG